MNIFMYSAFVCIDNKMFISFLRGVGSDLNQVLSEQDAVRKHTDPNFLDIFKSNFYALTVLLHLEQCGNGERSVHVTLPYGFGRGGVCRIWPQNYENSKIEIFSYTVDIDTDVSRRELLSFVICRSGVVEMDGGHIWHVTKERHGQWLTY
jgi:hypothetical protein